MDEIAIQVKNLSKVYKLYDKPLDRLKESINPLKKKYHKDFYALNDVSFEVKKGETIGIIGKNGSGKSTLLKIITGVLNPSAGNVIVNGKVSALLELGAGFNPEFTGIENIYLNGTIMGFSKEEMDSKTKDILEFADIGDFVYQPVKMYSSGMFARLAFAVAINVDPDILIVDEALSVGDATFQSKCYRKFNEFKEAGKTILFVTHSLESIIKYCSQGLVLDKGTKIEEGTAIEMVDVYKRLLVDCYYYDEDTNKVEVSNIDDNKTWKSSININPAMLEYGNKEAEIIDFGIFDNNNRLTNTILNGEEFTFRMKVRFNRTIDEPIFAYTIKDLKGTEVTGTNTIIENKITGTFHKGDIAHVVFRQNANLQNQNHMVSFGCTRFDSDQLMVYHRLYDAIIFETVSIKTTLGFFDPGSKVDVVKIKNT